MKPVPGPREVTLDEYIRARMRLAMRDADITAEDKPPEPRAGVRVRTIIEAAETYHGVTQGRKYFERAATALREAAEFMASLGEEADTDAVYGRRLADAMQMSAYEHTSAVNNAANHLSYLHECARNAVRDLGRPRVAVNDKVTAEAYSKMKLEADAVRKAYPIAKKRYGDRVRAVIDLRPDIDDELRVADAYIEFTTIPIVVDDSAGKVGRRQFGPFVIQARRGSFGTRHIDPNHPIHRTGYIAPHVDTTGRYCLGEWTGIINDAKSEMRYHDLFAAIEEFFIRGVNYNSENHPQRSRSWHYADAVCHECGGAMPFSDAIVRGGKAYHKGCTVLIGTTYYAKTEVVNINGIHYPISEMVVVDGIATPKSNLCYAGPYGNLSGKHAAIGQAKTCSHCLSIVHDSAHISNVKATSSPWHGLIMAGGEIVCASCLDDWYQEREVPHAERISPMAIWDGWRKAGSVAR